MAQLQRSMWCEEYRQLTQNLRDESLNEEYYACVSQSVYRWNLALELVIAFFVAGSAISGWAVWKTELGREVWAVFVGIATIASGVKPFLGLSQRAKTAGSLHMGHKGAHLELEQLYLDVRAKRSIDTADRVKRKAIIDRVHKLELQETRKQDDDLVRKCAEIVRRRYPAEQLWVDEFGPQEDGDDREEGAAASRT